jgi:hypothetical protein
MEAEHSIVAAKIYKQKSSSKIKTVLGFSPHLYQKKKKGQGTNL